MSSRLYRHFRKLSGARISHGILFEVSRIRENSWDVNINDTLYLTFILLNVGFIFLSLHFFENYRIPGRVVKSKTFPFFVLLETIASGHIAGWLREEGPHDILKRSPSKTFRFGLFTYAACSKSFGQRTRSCTGDGLRQSRQRRRGRKMGL